MDTRPYMHDKAAEEFFARLKEGEFKTTRCRSCGEIHYPPHVVCSACLEEEMEWVDLPREGTLVAFTQQRDAMRCRRPEVLGLVELEGIGNVITRIDASLEGLQIGMRVAFDIWVSPDGFVLHQFRPYS